MSASRDATNKVSAYGNLSGEVVDSGKVDPKRYIEDVKTEGSGYVRAQVDEELEKYSPKGLNKLSFSKDVISSEFETHTLPNS